MDSPKQVGIPKIPNHRLDCNRKRNNNSIKKKQMQQNHPAPNISVH